MAADDLVTIVDAHAGNLASVRKALTALGARTVITDRPEAVSAARRIVFPGVGAFGLASENLARDGLGDALRAAVEAGAELLGICLGMQLLFDESEEFGTHPGLGLLPGRVVRLSDAAAKVPHMGWNALVATGSTAPHPLLAAVPAGAHVFFCHSYHVLPERADDVIALARHGELDVTAAVARGNVAGTQFHPEKSQAAGLVILDAFLRGALGARS